MGTQDKIKNFMTSVKALVNLGGGVVGSSLLFSSTNELSILGSQGQCLAQFHLCDDSAVSFIIPGAPGVPARLQLTNGPLLLISYVGPALDDFFFVLTSQLSTSKSLSGKRPRLSSSSFYGPIDASWAAKLLRIGSEVPPEIFGPFSRQADAMAVLQIKPSLHLQLWSREFEPSQTVTASSGARQFFLASYDEFWRYYERLGPEDRCHYELIRDDTPAKLYLDVEYSRVLNPNLDGNCVMEKLAHFLTQFILLAFAGIKVGPPVHLESRYEHKFSRHVIFSDVVFRSTANMGAFMLAFREYLELRRDNDPDVALLFARTDKADHVFVCDMGVYTRNRNFRLVYSSKKGKDSHLVPIDGPRPVSVGASASSSNDGSPDASHQLNKEVFLNSLVCRIAEDKSLLEFDAPSSTMARGHGSGGFSRPDASMVSRPSPFPRVDAFVREEFLKGQGFIRSAIFFAQTNRICYNLGGTRFCANIGRHHKSNGVYLVVDIGTRTVVQKCHDPDCRGFSSMPIAVPALHFAPDNWAESGALIRAMIQAGDLASDSEMMALLDAFDEQAFEEQLIAFANEAGL